jgi:hypothetical protein
MDLDGRKKCILQLKKKNIIRTTVINRRDNSFITVQDDEKTIIFHFGNCRERQERQGRRYNNSSASLDIRNLYSENFAA